MASKTGLTYSYWLSRVSLVINTAFSFGFASQVWWQKWSRIISWVPTQRLAFVSFANRLIDSLQIDGITRTATSAGVACVRVWCRMKLDEGDVSFCDGSVLHSSQCEAGLGHDWMSAVIKLSSSLRRPPAVDLSSVASLAALTLVTGIDYESTQLNYFQRLRLFVLFSRLLRRLLSLCVVCLSSVTSVQGLF